jgi:branched-chain amino acid transport system ATP-binding protein
VTAILTIDRLSVGYGHVGVLSDVTMNVAEGKIIAVLGSNGAGKTTLLRAISGLLIPTTGSIRFQGNEIGGASPRRIVQAGLLHVAEGRALFRSRTVAENLRLGLYAAKVGREEREARYDRVFSLFPVLRERLSAVAGVLSGGQQQMLAIAQALMLKPTLLMLDEPSLGLAPIIVDQVLNVVLSLRDAGTTILLVEQMVERALEIADLGYVLQSGRLIGQGSPTDLIDGDVIRRAYLSVA